jgi:F-type H+-transporting ATPase subunit c
MKISTMVRVVGVTIGVLLIAAAPVLAQQEEKKYGGPPSLSNVSFSGAALGAGLGMGITIVGAGFGLGKIGSSALEAMARQPEVAARIQTAMIIIAAMLEGATLASVILCFLVGGAATF